MRRVELAPAGLCNAIGRANVSSPALRVEVTPSKRTDAFVSARPIWLAERTDNLSTTSVRDLSGRAGDHAGEQVDACTRYCAIPDRFRVEIDGERRTVWVGNYRTARCSASVKTGAVM